MPLRKKFGDALGRYGSAHAGGLWIVRLVLGDHLIRITDEASGLECRGHLVVLTKAFGAKSIDLVAQKDMIDRRLWGSWGQSKGDGRQSTQVKGKELAEHDGSSVGVKRRK